MPEIHELSAEELGQSVRTGTLHATETLAHTFARIHALDPEIGAFVHLCEARAMAEAKILDQRIAAGEDPGPLAGVPLGVKDLEDVSGLPTSFGSVVFRTNVAAQDSVQVARLRNAGAIVVGKTNTPEFGSTALTRNRLFPTTRNPWNTAHTPGGSSGGSAAAIAARMLPLVTASDGGGSIRIPACYVGAFGFKPTFGRVPVGPEGHGMLRWMDTVHFGPLVRSVRDAALFLDVVAGYDPVDPNSLPAPSTSYLSAVEQAPPRLRIAYSPDLGYASVDADVLAATEECLRLLVSLGHDVARVDLRLPDAGVAWAFGCGAEQYAELAGLVTGREDELGRGFWAGIKQTAHLSALDMGRIARTRSALNDAMSAVFAEFDVLVTPSLPTEAFGAQGPMPAQAGGVEFENPLGAVAFSYPFNLTGHPAATIRSGIGDQGLPVGVQLIAERHRDDLVLALSRSLELAQEKERGPLTWPAL
ncbi:MAG: aspartyl-tRNA(Asn)/glutamyl-tRNA(Gln) amidotransferase subunit A [Hyphomicrobiaceae bacterium]|jgi:aspartyl-tRNA(Asn)/glutamyl-tRNA(Gln) amidotransferase subunit A